MSGAKPDRSTVPLGAAFVSAQPVHPLAWAERLRMRELEGQRLSEAQRAMWRAALKNGAVLPDNGLQGDMEERKRQTQKRVDELLDR